LIEFPLEKLKRELEQENLRDAFYFRPSGEEGPLSPTKKK